MYKSRHCPINLNSLLSKKVLPILFPKSALISKWPYTIICALFFFSISAYRYQDCLRFQDRSVPERELFLDWLIVTRREEKESKGKQRKEKKRKEQKRTEEKRNEMKWKEKKKEKKRNKRYDFSKRPLISHKVPQDFNLPVHGHWHSSTGQTRIPENKTFLRKTNLHLPKCSNCPAPTSNPLYNIG